MNSNVNWCTCSLMFKDNLTAFWYASCMLCFAASAAPAAASISACCACWKEFRNFYKRRHNSWNYCTQPNLSHTFYHTHCSKIHGNKKGNKTSLFWDIPLFRLLISQLTFCTNRLPPSSGSKERSVHTVLIGAPTQHPPRHPSTLSLSCLSWPPSTVALFTPCHMTMTNVQLLSYSPQLSAYYTLTTLIFIWCEHYAIKCQPKLILSNFLKPAKTNLWCGTGPNTVQCRVLRCSKYCHVY